MYVYFFVFSFFAMLCGIDFFPNKRKRIIMPIFACAGIILIIFCGFRYNTGPDYANYRALFNEISVKKVWFFREPGFAAFIMFFDKYGTFRAMILFIAVLSISYKLFFFYKESKAVFLSLILYFSSSFLGDFGQIRQNFALCFSIMAFYAAYKNLFFRFLFFTVCACTWHYTALIILPFYFINKIRLTEQRVVYLFCICFICSFLFLPLFSFLVKVANNDYLKRQFGYFGNSSLSLGTFIIMSCMKLSIIIYYFSYKKTLLNNNKVYYFFNLYIWCYAFILLCRQISIISSRGTSYFDIYELILIPNIIVSIKRKERFVFCILIIIYAILCLYRNIAGFQDMFIPYYIDFNLNKP